MPSAEETIIEKKVHGAIELQQIITLELEIMGQEIDLNHDLDPVKLREAITRLVGYASNTASLLKEIRIESRNIILR